MPPSRSEFTALAALSLPGGITAIWFDDNLSASEGRCNGFRLCLVTVSRDVSAQGHYALLAILTYGNTFEAGLIKRLANVDRNVG